MTQVTYIWHDCFVIETSEIVMVFDFWKDPTSPKGMMPKFINEIDDRKPVYVFVSHHHKDHYTKRIFEWGERLPNIKYIISKDVAKYARHILTADSLYYGIKPDADRVNVLDKGDEYRDDHVKVEAFGSTDIGNSYYIEVYDGKNIVSFFHAGDLNAWLWLDESTEDEIKKARADYEGILFTISSRHPSIDYVMFPVDSRIGREYFTGAKQFVNVIRVNHFFPMHFTLGENSEECNQRMVDATNLKLYANLERGEYICLTTPYSSFLKGEL